MHHAAAAVDCAKRYTLASSDIMVFLYREKTALANLFRHFGETEAAGKADASAALLKAALHMHLWDESTGPLPFPHMRCVQNNAV